MFQTSTLGSLVDMLYHAILRQQTYAPGYRKLQLTQHNIIWRVVRLPWHWDVPGLHAGPPGSHAGPRPGSDLPPEHAHRWQSKVSTACNKRDMLVSDKQRGGGSSHKSMQPKVSTACNTREKLVSDKQRKYTQVHAVKR